MRFRQSRTWSAVINPRCSKIFQFPIRKTHPGLSLDCDTKTWKGFIVTKKRASMTIALAPYWAQSSGFGALISINSRDATLAGWNVMAEVRAIPAPLPKMKTAASSVSIAWLNRQNLCVNGFASALSVSLSFASIVVSIDGAVCIWNDDLLTNSQNETYSLSCWHLIHLEWCFWELVLPILG